ncbi:MAG: hypothetical protein M1818_000458 [Claussenomyces sp. TS43310]|nr:MAG: hypothetical protein M1818_000458 [Claussenomyces sp. TS43310]
MPQLAIHRLVVAGIFILAFFGQVQALDVEYCSSINTASTNANSSIYQSNGLCQHFCDATYAFAVLQDSTCWCSDYVPGTTVSSGCDTSCPGFPADLCGGSGLYGYIALGNPIKGTQGAPSSSQEVSSTTPDSVTAISTPQMTVTTSAQPNTVFATVTLSPSSQSHAAAATSSSVAPPPSSSKTPVTTPTTTPDMTPDTTTATTTATTSAVIIAAAPTKQSSTSSEDNWTPTPVTSLETVTGQVKTVTIIPSSPPSAASQTAVTASKKSGGISTGGAVGLTIGLVALVGLVGTLAFFFIRRRRRGNADGMGSRRPSPKGSMTEVPQRTLSESSRYMLNSDGRQVTEAWEGDSDGPAPGSRKSRLMPVDPRLDPFAPVYQRDGRRSHESMNTLRDDHDYSRKVLRTTNPDL